MDIPSLKLKVDKDSTTICIFHEHYEMKSCFVGKTGQYFQILTILATTVYSLFFKLKFETLYNIEIQNKQQKTKTIRE